MYRENKEIYRKNRRAKTQSINEQRSDFRKFLMRQKKAKKVTNKEICEAIGLKASEFSNMLYGYQEAVPSKGVLSFEQFEKEVKNYLDTCVAQH